MAMSAVARAGSRLLRLDSNVLAARIQTSRRSFSADRGHGPAKVNMWEQPGNPGNWKDEHFVFVSLAGWGALFFSGYKAATGGGSKKKAPAKPAAKSHPKPDPKPAAKKPEAPKKAAAKPPRPKPESKPAPKKPEPPPKKADSSTKPPRTKAEPASE